MPETPTPITPPTPPEAGDADLAAQARPGYGVPSQDPRPGAQQPLSPAEATREAGSTLAAGGVLAGAAAGAAVGAVVGGPAGVVVGGAVGGIAGAVGGAAAGKAIAGAGVGLHIEDSGGNGRPVVLIHGWPLSGQAWQAQVPLLAAAGYRVVVYDRRGFGRSAKPASGYGYDQLADDLAQVLDECGLQQDVTLVGFSMGGGEVARYVARHGQARLRSVVFAAAVPPFMMQGPDNPEGPLTPEKAKEMKQNLEQDRDAFFEQFTRDFFSANGRLVVSEQQRAEAVALCRQSDQQAALACMESFGTTDFRNDLQKLTVPTLVLHGDADGIVPLEGSGLRTHRAVPHSGLVTVPGAPHGLNTSHPREFNDALIAFLREG